MDIHLFIPAEYSIFRKNARFTLDNARKNGSTVFPSVIIIQIQYKVTVSNLYKWISKY